MSRPTAILALFFVLLLAACPAAQKPPEDPAGNGNSVGADFGEPMASPEGKEAKKGEGTQHALGRQAPAEDQETRGPLVLDGTPEIPGELRQRMGQYLNTRSASLQDLSADGSKLLVSTRFGETRQLHLVGRPLGARTQLTFADEPIAGASFVPGSSTQLIYMADVGGNEQDQLYFLDLEKGRTHLLTDGKSRTIAYEWSKSGDKLAFATNRRNGRDFDIWISDGRDPESAKKLLDAKGYWYPLDFSRAGDKLLVGEYVSITDSRVYLADTETGEVERLTPEEPVAAHGSAVFSRDGKRAYITSDRDGEFVSLYEVPLAGGDWRPLTPKIPWNVEQLALSPSGRTLAFTTNEGGISALYLLDTRSRRYRRAKAIPKGLLGGLEFADKKNVLGFTMSSATRTGDAYSYDLSRRKLTRWTESEVGGLDTSTFVEPELIEYETFDDKKIPAFYYDPPGKGPHPVVINIHGGPESQSRPWFSSLTQFLVVERGVAVLYPNVRGSAGYGKSYVKLDNADKREDSVKDIGALLDWIAEQPELDAERVAVYGGSYGGYMVLASLVHFGDRLRAGVDVVGISNFVTFLENTADYRRDLRRVEYGDERDPEMRKHLQEISPLTHADKIQSALFVAQGANDPRVPASEAEQIVEAVRASGHDCWYMLAKNEGHGFRKKENRDTFVLLSALFFEKHLLSEE